jgi:hypothetical protein
VFDFRGFSPERQTLDLKKIEIGQRIKVRFVLLRRGYEGRRRQTAQVKNFQKHREARSLSDLAGEPNTSSGRPPAKKNAIE